MTYSQCSGTSKHESEAFLTKIQLNKEILNSWGKKKSIYSIALFTNFPLYKAAIAHEGGSKCRE